MNVFYDTNKITSVAKNYIVLDTSVLFSCSSSIEYFNDFLHIFTDNTFLIDPIVKLEFLRTSYIEKTYQEKSAFLNYERFLPVTDHQSIYLKVQEHAFNIARIYSHQGKSQVPLGDILITARLSLYDDNRLFLTLDKEDYSSLLFDRIDILTFEKMTPKSEVLESAQLLQFNSDKYKKALAKLP